MTRQAARSGFERFVEDALGYTEREFSVAQALQSDATGAGGKVVDRLLSDSEAVRERVVSPELSTYREQILAQFDVLLDAVGFDSFVALDGVEQDIELRENLFAVGVEFRPDDPLADGLGVAQESVDNLAARSGRVRLQCLGDAELPFGVGEGVLDEPLEPRAGCLPGHVVQSGPYHNVADAGRTARTLDESTPARRADSRVVNRPGEAVSRQGPSSGPGFCRLTDRVLAD